MQNHNPIGTVKGPGEGPQEYLFITRDNSRTRIGDFVFYEARDGQKVFDIVGTIKKKRLIRNLPDSFFDNPKISPESIASLIGMEPKQELYEVAVENVGYFDEKLKDFINLRIQPNPGDSVYFLPSEMLAKIISPKEMGEEGAAYVGNLLLREEVPVVLAVEEFTSTHLAILASTGSGKSYTAGVLIEELMKPYNCAAVLIIDPHGEYHTLTDMLGIQDFKNEHYRPEVKVFHSDQIKVKLSTLTESDIKYLLPEGASEKMNNLLSQAYRSLTERIRRVEKRENYRWKELYDEVESLRDKSNESSIDGLKWRIEARFGRSRSIFSDNEHIHLRELFRPGRCTILQLSDIEQSEQQVIVATILRRVNKARVETERRIAKENSESYLPYPVFILLEEAHRFAPSGRAVVSTDILKQILSEGRKFGIGVGLISQRPGKLDQDILSQCMTQIIMRIVNPIDQATIAQSVEGVGRWLLDELPALSKGQAIISGASINLPVMCRIRKRLTKHGGANPNPPSKWIEWLSEGEKLKREQRNAPYIRQNNAEDTEKFGGIPV
ncbi:MAG: ATP-binding protein [Pyrinomonadaceae bacterium]|nr:ATP-binding protein [Pyrinomonadaceae bacterium]MCX7640581.1 ATP-binding protein [Pyrinomonadaceae bacterium]MDW8303838.1 ATP-binding protein [Acidobacteriota bacterium]